MRPKKLVEKAIAEGLEDVKRGRVLGPFKSAKAAIRALKRRPRPRRSKRRAASSAPTRSEERAIRRGRAQIARGEYVTLEELRRAICQ